MNHGSCKQNGLVLPRKSFPLCVVLGEGMDVIRAGSRERETALSYMCILAQQVMADGENEKEEE